MKKSLQTMMPALALAACAQMPALAQRPRSDWDRTLFYARGDVATGNYFAADKLLDEFVRTHPGTPEAGEIRFWKAAYMIDPANERGSLDSGIAALDEYLATSPNGWYRDQAIVLRRTAAVAQAIASQVKPEANDSSVATGVKGTVVSASKTRDEQIASLKDQLAKSKDELAKANAELDRIKKRLANPSN